MKVSIGLLFGGLKRKRTIDKTKKIVQEEINHPSGSAWSETDRRQAVKV